ncbi:1-deoxy-D-xylulose-5-phosphate synthase [Adlercreutzia aquisgranensis]|uniref:1-deoxy-D-xylulose-5-phosphate synthase n=1 Tax=Adlercreutzia aquisgranensis TaxID=2941323 RepID=UPI00203EC30C|nr:1-deoxy-D-xylulose-5-phosphate synthase [Adlercreutzia aquisgranensis]
MEGNRILDVVTSPSDLKALSDEELSILACEIREQILETTACTGGHVASSLGAVEIILAVHSLIDCPHDRFVFDVGHQSYAHKLVTGRLDEFRSLRTYGGLSGFPKPEESPFDAHPSGHASDSLSVAYGLAEARDLRGDEQKIVALIGDASLAGGMAFEALNQIGQSQTPMVIILNDNEMSISRNVGALMKHLGYMRTTAEYRQARDSIQERMEKNGPVARALMQIGRNVKDSMKHMAIPRSMIFEQLGILCTAPIDGHNIGLLKETLAVALAADCPVLVHVVTKKGAGYAPAERDPETFHGIGPFDLDTGLAVKKPVAPPSYTSVFGQALVREAEADERIVAMTAAMKGGTGLKEFAERFPERFFDEGIAEEHMVAMASGLALGGAKPVVAVYSTFLQRAIDQMIIDCCLPDLDVVFAIDRAGVVGEDGPTHHGMFDLVYTRMVPHMKVLAPSDEAELIHCLHTALALGGPVSVRYPRGEGQGVALPDKPEVLPVGESKLVREGTDIAILAFGRMVSPSLEAARLLSESGIETRVVDMRWVKPLDRQAIRRAAQTQLVVTVEGGVVAGGAGEGVLAVMAEEGCLAPALNLGIGDRFIHQGKTDLLLADLGLDGKGIAEAVEQKYLSL